MNARRHDRRSDRLPVPRFVNVSKACCRLRMDGVEQPGAAEELLATVTEHLEAKHIDRNVAGAKRLYCRS